MTLPKQEHLEQVGRARTRALETRLAAEDAMILQRSAIRAARGAGCSLGDIAKVLGVSRAYVAEVCRHVPLASCARRPASRKAQA